MNQETAATLSWDLRVAAYAEVHGLSPKGALEQLVEYGLEKVLEEELIKQGPEWMPPIFLYASYLRLMGLVDGHKPAPETI